LTNTKKRKNNEEQKQKIINKIIRSYQTIIVNEVNKRDSNNFIKSISI